MARKMTRKDVERILHFLNVERVGLTDRTYFQRKQGYENEMEIKMRDEVEELMEVFTEYMKKQDLRKQ